MNQSAVGFGRGFPRLWLLPIVTMTVLLGVAAAGYFSRSIVADLLAWWPIWLGLGIAAYLLRDRRFGTIRAAGLVPLAAFVMIGLFLWGHLAGWAIMPSASQRLVGPDPGGYATASLRAVVDGELDIGNNPDFLYLVEPIKHGGTVGIPTAAEQVGDDSIAVSLQPPSDPGIYSFAGWHIGLSPEPLWTLDLDGAVRADLTSLVLSHLWLRGSGTVRLGQSAGETPVQVDGQFHVVIPSDTPARVIGVASIPESWTLTEDGATSPAGSDGWVFTVVGEGVLSVSER